MKKWKWNFNGPFKYLLNYPRTGVDADEYVWGNSCFSLQSAIDKGAPLNEALQYIEQVYNHKLLQKKKILLFIGLGHPSHQDNIPHCTVIGPDEWFYQLVVVLLGSGPGAQGLGGQ